jgi:PAB1-binding protein PBP1
LSLAVGYFSSGLIFSQGTINNPHIAEERNMNVDDSGMNEEDKCVNLV